MRSLSASRGYPSRWTLPATTCSFQIAAKPSDFSNSAAICSAKLSMFHPLAAPVAARCERWGSSRLTFVNGLTGRSNFDSRTIWTERFCRFRPCIRSVARRVGSPPLRFQRLAFVPARSRSCLRTRPRLRYVDMANLDENAITALRQPCRRMSPAVSTVHR